jgi:hypothetical protein
MHVKTDVFCSASIILPDKAGRQLNVGGWSLLSTFGVRLFTPDGFPGVPSYNDWQENADVLHLQVMAAFVFLLIGIHPPELFREVVGIPPHLSWLMVSLRSVNEYHDTDLYQAAYLSWVSVCGPMLLDRLLTGTGGEIGSNGPPEPSLEILPTPEGGNTTIYLDWLQHTDPNNLYPFLFVLPSGNIFVGLYSFISCRDVLS